MRTIRQQIKAMKRRWRHFEVVTETNDHVIWHGTIRPLSKVYRISIEYGLPRTPSNDPMYREFPIVRVISPQLEPNPDADEEAPLPHVYFDTENLPLSPLCLFDPDANEWSHNDLIAETTVPWSSDWLACYEAWLATGRWFGGGRHANIGNTNE